MDDAAYLDALMAILTNPSPTGISHDSYGMADDGIDRYDGFGRDARVTGLEIVEGRHGAELEVSYELAVPRRARRRTPRNGTVRLPFDTEWRQLSGYADPADWAPRVARSVQAAAMRLVETSQSSRGSRRALPTREEQWRLLLEALSGEGRAVEVAPGRIEVDVDAEDEVLTVLVTPEQWEQVLLEDDALDDPELYLQELIGPRDDDEQFVVFYQGGLCRSTRAELPPVRGTAAERELAEIRARHPDMEFFWTAE
jgi:hypothetical protein